MASKFVKKKFWNSCASLFRFQNIYRTNKRHCPSVLNTKEKSARFAGTSINLYDRHANYSHGAKQRSLLPHVFAVFGVVCGGNSNENENSAKSGISQDVTTPVRTTSRQRAHGARMVLWENETTKEHWSHERSRGSNLGDSKRLRLRVVKRKLVLESATDENERLPKCQTRSLKVKCNSSSTALVHAKSIIEFGSQ